MQSFLHRSSDKSEMMMPEACISSQYTSLLMFSAEFEVSFLV